MQERLIECTYEEANALFKSNYVDDERMSMFDIPIGNNITYYLLDILTKEEFLNIHWHFIREANKLNILSEGRKLKDNAMAFINSGYNYDDLNDETLPIPENQWFDRCQIIHDEFDMNKLGIPVLRHFYKLDFRKHLDNLYIADGNHRLLVYAIKLLLDEIDFKPFKVIYLHYSKNRTM